MKVAIVVLNWNGQSWLERFLPTLLKFSREATIFVADNGSTDGSIMFLKSAFPEIKIIINESNEGYAKGYNSALSSIVAEYFVLINSDIEVTKGWLDPVIELMDSDNSIAACQPKLLDYNSRNYFEYAGASGGFIDNLGYPFCRGRIFDVVERDQGQYDDTIEIFWATGACLFVRASYFWEIGGLDDDFFAHQEEIDLCWRFKNRSYKIMVEPKSKVYHFGGGTLDSHSPFKTYLNFRNNLFMIFKNLTFSSLIIVIPCRLILDGVAALVFLLKPNGIKHFISIIRAHVSFYIHLPNLTRKRKKITQKNRLIGKLRKSILFLHRIKGVNKFSDL